MSKSALDSVKRKDDDDIDEVATDARNRFQGELLKLNEGGHSTDSDEGKTKVKRGKRHRKSRLSSIRNEFTSHYVMKMYDRSINLAEFNSNTPLYPLCRTWFKNNPHSTNRFYKHKDEKKEKRNDHDIYNLPPPAPHGEMFVPSPRPSPDKSGDFDLNYDSDTSLPTKDELLFDHRERWLKARDKTLRDCALRSQRYRRSIAVLTAIYTPPS